MTKLARTCLLALVVAGCTPPPRPPARAEPATAVAPIDATHVSATLAAYVASIGKDWGDAARFSGVVLVAQQDRILYEHGFGFANRETRAPNTIDTSFRIGSVTKQFTAAAILVLEARGKLAVTDPVSKYLPDFPAPAAAVTIHQLLTHTSGIPNYTEDPELMKERHRAHTPAQLLARFAARPLEFEPGTRWNYSNSNYALLGAIVERVSGKSYATFMHEAIIEPAGLTRTVVGDAESLPDRALGYDGDGDQLVEAHPIDMSVPFAAGAIRSTARDLWTWHRALETEKILSSAARAKLYRVEANDYAYGWMVHDIDGRRVIEHGGGIDGFLTSYMRVPDSDLVIVVISNNTSVRPERIARAAFDTSHGKRVEPLDEGKPGELDPEVGRRSAGQYRITDAARQALVAKGLPAAAISQIESVEVTAKDDALAFKAVGQPSVDLKPTESGAFVAPQIGVTVTFDLDPTGAPATRMHIDQGGLTIDYERAR